MKQKFLIIVGYLFLLALIVILTFRMAFLQRLIADNNKKLSDRMAAFESSVISADGQISSLKEQVPGLGEYMTGLQLHMAKLWYAAGVSNWRLADYELHEMSETADAVAALKVSRNNLDISDEIKSKLAPRFAALQKSIDGHSIAGFSDTYKETLNSCNGCHDSSGYPFIHITEPSAPPVTNQLWEEFSPKN
ncbi:MAG TPA: hypothetical protein VHC46_07150 [Thermodesulfobacteriota bacterium]|nr:hypothetical protein [Thermodesulfobacteriota bacterium]